MSRNGKKSSETIEKSEFDAAYDVLSADEKLRMIEVLAVEALAAEGINLASDERIEAKKGKTIPEDGKKGTKYIDIEIPRKRGVEAEQYEAAFDQQGLNAKVDDLYPLPIKVTFMGKGKADVVKAMTGEDMGKLSELIEGQGISQEQIDTRIEAKEKEGEQPENPDSGMANKYGAGTTKKTGHASAFRGPHSSGGNPAKGSINGRF